MFYEHEQKTAKLLTTELAKPSAAPKTLHRCVIVPSWTAISHTVVALEGLDQNTNLAPEPHRAGFRTRTRSNTHPYDREAGASDRIVRVCVARESKHKEMGRQVRWAQAPSGVGEVVG